MLSRGQVLQKPRDDQSGVPKRCLWSTTSGRVTVLTTFCRLDELGPEAVGQRPEPDQAVIECRIAEPRSPISGQHCREALLQIFDEILGNLQRREMSPDLRRPPSDDLSVPLLRPGARILLDVAGIDTDC